MRKIALLTCFLSLILACPLQAKDVKKEADPKKTEAAPAAEKAESTDKGALSKKDISEGMSEVWCQKMEECSKDKSLGPIECRKMLFKTFKTGFDNVPKGQSIDVSKEKYDECMKNVQAGTCDSLKTAQTLPGCEFISQLNKGN